MHHRMVWAWSVPEGMQERWSSSLKGLEREKTEHYFSKPPVLVCAYSKAMNQQKAAHSMPAYTHTHTHTHRNMHTHKHKAKGWWDRQTACSAVCVGPLCTTALKWNTKDELPALPVGGFFILSTSLISRLIYTHMNLYTFIHIFNSTLLCSTNCSD